MSSKLSQTALAQTSVAAPAVHFPVRVGPVCGGSDGTAVPFVSFALQAWLVSLHHWPGAQSVSTLQPLAGRHNPFALHDPERHTVAALAPVQGPWFVA